MTGVSGYVTLLDEIRDLKKSILLMAPVQHRKALCNHVLTSVADVVEEVLSLNGGDEQQR
jgi:hypothetical protein